MIALGNQVGKIFIGRPVTVSKDRKIIYNIKNKEDILWYFNY